MHAPSVVYTTCLALFEQHCMSASPWEQLPLAGRQRRAGQVWELINMCMGGTQRNVCLCRATGKVNIVKDPFSASEEKKLGVVLLSPRSQAAKLPAHYLSGGLVHQTNQVCTVYRIYTVRWGFCFALPILLAVFLRQPCSLNAACQVMQRCSCLTQRYNYSQQHALPGSRVRSMRKLRP